MMNAQDSNQAIVPPLLTRPRLSAPTIRLRLPSLNTVVMTAIPLIILALWQCASSYNLINAAIAPSPLNCWRAWVRWSFGSSQLSLDAYSGTWTSNVAYSISRVAKGFGIACLTGIPIGILIGWYRQVRVIDPTIQLLRPIPITAWLPFSIAAFGIHDASAVFLIAFGGFYPIVISAAHGTKTTNPTLVRAARMLGASQFYVLRRVVVPSALPSIFTGLRLASGTAWTAVVIAEMVSVKSGLGYVLWDAYYMGRMDIVIADMVSIGLLGFASDLLIIFLGHTFTPGAHK